MYYNGDEVREECIQKSEVKNYEHKSKIRWPRQPIQNIGAFKYWTNYLN